jgi:hypothetical protein
MTGYREPLPTVRIQQTLHRGVCFDQDRHTPQRSLRTALFADEIYADSSCFLCLRPFKLVRAQR